MTACMDAIKPLSRLSLLVLLWCWATTANAAVLFVVPSYAPTTMSIINKVNQEVPQNVDIKQLVDIVAVDLKSYQAIVLVGATVLEQWQPVADIPTLAILVSQAQWQAHQQFLVSGIYAEPSLTSQFMLARTLLGPDKTLGILCQNAKQWQQTELSKLDAKQLSYVRVLYTDEYDTPYHALQKLLQSSQALVGIYDAEPYSSENIKRTLIAAYRQNQPLIGPSAAYVRAGAIASINSSATDTAKRLGEVLTQGLRDKTWPAPDYNPYFSVQLNAQVARSLNLELPDAEMLAAQVRQLMEH